MSGADRTGFGWKEIAEVLHITEASAPVTFWREVRRPKAASKPVAIVHEEESDSESLKRDKLVRGSRRARRGYPFKRKRIRKSAG